MTAQPTITLQSAPVSRCAAVQEMAEALRVLLQIAARIDGASVLRLDQAPVAKLGSFGQTELGSFGQAQEKPASEGNERV